MVFKIFLKTLFIKAAKKQQKFIKICAFEKNAAIEVEENGFIKTALIAQHLICQKHIKCCAINAALRISYGKRKSKR